MPYQGDQEHWYGPGTHETCKRCGYCADCKLWPIRSDGQVNKGCPSHPRKEKELDG